MSIELFVGGGGRLLDLGPVTVRMALFAAALLATASVHLRCADPYKWRSLPILLLMGFFCTHFPSMLVGWAKGALLQDIFADISPMLFWLTAPFFFLVLKSESMVYRTATLIQWSAVGMALAYLIVFTALAAGVGYFDGFHSWANKTGEIAFRNHQMFFFKGFIYLGIGIVFFAALEGPLQKVGLMVVVAALTLTLTRGFVVATSLAVVLLLVTMRRKLALALALCVIAVAIYAVWVYLPSFDGGHMLAQRGISNSVRAKDILFMQEHFDLSGVVLGEGMGTYINGRFSVENSYLMILWKMGLTALLFWLLPLGIALHYFRHIDIKSEHYNLACAFFFGLILVYVQTGTNPYLNNPIGLSFVLMAVFSLRTLALSSAGCTLQPAVAAAVSS